MDGTGEEKAIEVIPVVQEEVRIDTVEVPVETVRVRTTVHEDEHAIDEPIRHKRVDVARVAVDRIVEQPVPDRREGDTLIISLFEEIVTLERRFRITEEVHVRTYYEEEVHHEVVRTRRKEATIERG